MKSDRKYILLFLILVGLGFMGWYYVQQEQKDFSVKLVNETPQTIAYQVIARQYDNNGKLNRTMIAPELENYPKKNTASFKNPTFLLKHSAVKITADTVDYNFKAGIGHFKGHVTVDDTTSHMRANRADTKANSRNELQYATAFGQSNKQAYFWSIKQDNKPPMFGYADRIDYDPPHHRVKLQGKAKVTQGNDSYSAPTILYDTQAMRVISKLSKQGRTTILLHRQHS